MVIFFVSAMGGRNCTGACTRVNSCSYFSLFDYRYATSKTEYKYDYDKINIESVREPIDAKEEAVMLIGGS